jgi:periplasmic divalent cation tolerance protein
MTDIAILYVTAGSDDEAQRIARTLLDERLIACANLVGNVLSFYRWKGATEQAAETLLVMKTRLELAGRVTERVRQLHSYEVCEVLTTTVADGNPSYLDWVRSETVPLEDGQANS